MTLHLDDKWVWDFWFAQNGGDYHIFYLQAPRALEDAQLRHTHSSIGHAVSQDLIHWEILPDAIHPSVEEGAWDSLAVWTGCTLQYQGTWYMFYTGTGRKENGTIQRIGTAVSKDLLTWTKLQRNPIMALDSSWYELYSQGEWYEQTWRDPWVFECEDRFHALITARANQGESKSRGVIGHAVSSDLLHWEVAEPLTSPGDFAYLEVPQLVKLNANYYLIFCVEKENYSDQFHKLNGERAKTGTHYFIADHPLGPFSQPEDNVLFGDALASYYSGKLIQENSGEWKFMTAVQNGDNGNYIGDISDPMPIIINGNREIKVVDRRLKIKEREKDER